MPGIDYHNIRQQISVVLKADPSLSADGVRVFLENEIAFGAEDVPAVFVYLENRTAPAGDQRIAAGTRTDYNLQFSLWCAHFSLEDLQTAVRFRDDLISKVEVALMKNRTLNGSVRTLWLTGGEFFLARDQESGYYSLGEIQMTAQVITTTV